MACPTKQQYKITKTTMTDKMNEVPRTIYTATTPAELRAAVLNLCCEALAEWDTPDVAARYYSGRHYLHVAEAVVPLVPEKWRIVTVSGQMYRCVDGVLQYMQGDKTWAKVEWVHNSHISMFADLIANPT